MVSPVVNELVTRLKDGNGLSESQRRAALERLDPQTRTVADMISVESPAEALLEYMLVSHGVRAPRPVGAPAGELSLSERALAERWLYDAMRRIGDALDAADPRCLFNHHADAVSALCRKHHVRRLALLGDAAERPSHEQIECIADFDENVVINGLNSDQIVLAVELEKRFGRPVVVGDRAAIKNPHARRMAEASEVPVYGA